MIALIYVSKFTNNGNSSIEVDKHSHAVPDEYVFVWFRVLSTLREERSTKAHETARIKSIPLRVFRGSLYLKDALPSQVNSLYSESPMEGNHKQYAHVPGRGKRACLADRASLRIRSRSNFDLEVFQHTTKEGE